MDCAPTFELLEGVGNVFEEDDAEDDMLVFRCVYVAAKLVGGEPKLGLKLKFGGGVLGFGSRSTGHVGDFMNGAPAASEQNATTQNHDLTGSGSDRKPRKNEHGI